MDEKSDHQKAGAIAAIIGLIHPEARAILSAMLVFLAFFVLMLSLFRLPDYIKSVMSPPPTHSLSECWELKEISGRLIRFNKCTGDALAFDLNSVPAKTK